MVTSSVRAWDNELRTTTGWSPPEVSTESTRAESESAVMASAPLRMRA